MTDNAPHQSPISPGYSWYEASAGTRPDHPALDGDCSADICIVGGGFTGLSAAVEAAKRGASVVLLEAHKLGDGGSGRNGGQLNTGQRSWPEDHEQMIGFERAKALFDIAEEAKAHLLEFTSEHGIDMEYVEGHMSVAHRARYVRDYRAHVDIAASRFGYDKLRFMERDETAERTGTGFYHCGVYDSGTGHIHPMKLVLGTASVAKKLGASLHENTKVLDITSEGGKVRVRTATGTVTAGRVLVGVNGYGDSTLDRETASHVMPIRSFIGATVPLTGEMDTKILRGRESVDDSRFVVRYFRRTRDGRMLFGGREAYTSDTPKDIAAGVRKQMAELYPALADIEITHAWGGSVGITMPRQIFVREVKPGVTSIGGYSGHGVMLSNFTGKMWAEAVCGNRDRLNYFRDLKVPAFPGGRTMRKPLLTLALTWYAMLDKL